MGRKPHKKIRLTNTEFKVVNKVAHWTRVDESWFYLNDRTESETAVYDMERNYWVSLQYGLKLLRESYGGIEDEDFIKDGILSRKELKIWQKVFERAF